MVVTATPGFDVVGEAESGEEAVELADALEPGLVLMDINLPGINGIEATRQITAAHPGTVVMLLSTYQEADLPADAVSCGAARYVHKEQFGPDVVRDVWARARSDRSLVPLGARPAATPRAGCGRRCGCRVPGDDSTAMLPPMAPTRSLMFTNPCPWCAPCSCRSPRRRRPRRRAAHLLTSRTLTLACDPAPACFAAFCSASSTQK